MEGAGPPEETLSGADHTGNAQHGRRHGGDPRAGRLHVEDRPDGPDGGLIAREGIAHITHIGGGAATTGELPLPLCGRHRAHARRKRGPAPDEIMDMRFRPAHQSLFTNVPARAPTDTRTCFEADAEWRSMLQLDLGLDEGHQSSGCPAWTAASPEGRVGSPARPFSLGWAQAPPPPPPGEHRQGERSVPSSGAASHLLATAEAPSAVIAAAMAGAASV